MNARKDILVTGCCGGMGSAICKKLMEQNYRVFGIDKKMFDSNNEYNIHDDINVLNFFHIP